MPVQYDLVITGDRVIDPANGLNGAAQVAVKDGKIAAVAERLPPHNVAGAKVNFDYPIGRKTTADSLLENNTFKTE